MPGAPLSRAKTHEMRSGDDLETASHVDVPAVTGLTRRSQFYLLPIAPVFPLRAGPNVEHVDREPNSQDSESP